VPEWISQRNDSLHQIAGESSGMAPQNSNIPGNQANRFGKIAEWKISFDSYLLIVGSDGISFCSSLFRNCPTLTAENLFPREQLALALFRECKKKAQRRAAADRFAFGKLTHSSLARRFSNRSSLLL
jgi:hypothetical protein